MAIVNGISRTRRQMEIDLFSDGVMRKVPVMCDCQAEENERQIAEDKYDVHKVNAVMLREMGITRAATEGEAQA